MDAGGGGGDHHKPDEVRQEEEEDPGTADGLFDDPDDYYPPTPPPTTQTYTMRDGAAITLHLVGHSPLEAHHLWNGARAVAAHFEARPEEVAGRTVLELGAGAGLPSLVAAALGARRVVVTDFPDADLVANMWRNIHECALIPGTDAAAAATAGGDEAGKGADGTSSSSKPVIVAEGYVWGADVAPLLAHLPADPPARPGFDVLVLADLLFRHSEHGRLLDSIEAALRRRAASVALVVFTSYRPWLQHKDLAFFGLARDRGFEVAQFLEHKTQRPLFEDDPGDEEVRKTVTGFTLRWPADKWLE